MLNQSQVIIRCPVVRRRIYNHLQVAFRSIEFPVGKLLSCKQQKLNLMFVQLSCGFHRSIWISGEPLRAVVVRAENSNNLKSAVPVTIPLDHDGFPVCKVLLPLNNHRSLRVSPTRYYHQLFLPAINILCANVDVTIPVQVGLFDFAGDSFGVVARTDGSWRQCVASVTVCDARGGGRLVFAANNRS
ncbi:MAG: hypothetical protein O2960_27645, partial [Verrucomicrobia bacterium]|nr:hypothetical protein [Verrucomicrobiota bacterium]